MSVTFQVLLYIMLHPIKKTYKNNQRFEATSSYNPVVFIYPVRPIWSGRHGYISAVAWALWWQKNI